MKNINNNGVPLEDLKIEPAFKVRCKHVMKPYTYISVVLVVSVQLRPGCLLNIS